MQDIRGPTHLENLDTRSSVFTGVPAQHPDSSRRIDTLVDEVGRTRQCTMRVRHGRCGGREIVLDRRG